MKIKHIRIIPQYVLICIIIVYIFWYVHIHIYHIHIRIYLIYLSSLDKSQILIMNLNNKLSKFSNWKVNQNINVAYLMISIFFFQYDFDFNVYALFVFYVNIWWNKLLEIMLIIFKMYTFKKYFNEVFIIMCSLAHTFLQWQ